MDRQRESGQDIGPLSIFGLVQLTKEECVECSLSEMVKNRRDWEKIVHEGIGVKVCHWSEMWGSEED